VAWASATPGASQLPAAVRDGSGAAFAHVRAAADALLLDPKEVRAYDASAAAAVRDFARRELEDARRLVSGGAGAGAGEGGGGARAAATALPALPALLEQHFSFQLDAPAEPAAAAAGAGAPGAVRLTGYIDRVDVAAVPPEQSHRHHDGLGSLEATVREFKSGQHWRAFAALGLRDKLKTLQPDIYGMAVARMLHAGAGAGAGAGGGSGHGSQQGPGVSGEAAVRVAIESIELGSAEGKLVNERVAAAAAARIADVAARIRGGLFEATPGEVACTWCSFSAVCASAFDRPRKAAAVAAAVSAPGALKAEMGGR
jgi:hypothetical protein